MCCGHGISHFLADLAERFDVDRVAFGE